MDSDLLSNVQKRKGTLGGAQGFTYEIKLILLFMIRACFNQVSFKLVTNVDGFGNFDDLIADCELQDKTKTVFCVQAKHLTSKNKISINNHALTGETSHKKTKIKSKEPFKLSKYRNDIIKPGSLFSNDRDFKLLFATTATIDDSDPDVQWCDVPPQDIVCQLFNTSDVHNCVKRFSETGNEKLLSSLDNDRDFLSKVCFVSSQCSVGDLDIKLQEDLGKLIRKQDQHVIKKVFAHLYGKVSDWYLEECFENKLCEQNFSEINVHESVKKNTVEAYYTESRFLKSVLEFALKELPCFSLEKELEHLARNYSNFKSEMCTKINNNSLLVINTGDSSTLLALLEVYKAIKGSSNEGANNLGNLMFVKSQDLGQAMNLFEYFMDLIIIDCKNIGVECVSNISKIEQIVVANKKKRAVFIVSNKTKHVVPQTSEIIDYYFHFDSLTSETQNYLLDYKIMFQDNEMPLRDLINKDDVCNVVRSKIVEKILKQETVVIGKKLQGLNEETEYCYIERSFHCTPVVSSDIFKTLAKPGSSDILIVSVQQPSDLAEHQNKFVNIVNIKQNRKCSLFYSLDQSVEVYQMLENCGNIFPDKNVHWLEVKQSCFIWVETKGSVENIDKYVTICSLENGEKCTNGVGEDIVVSSKNNTNIIIDTAGMGKTTVLNKIARKLKKQHQTCWVVHCDLNSNHILSKLSKIKIENRTLEIQELCFEEKLDNIEKLVFEYLLSVRKVVFCFDGFDEICPRYKNECMHFLKMLRNSFAKFWLTSRENMESYIKENLYAFPMKLLPITEQNTIDMCTNYYQYELDNKCVSNKDKISQFSAALILRLNSLNKSIVEFMGIPLLTNMLAIINIKKCKQALDQKNKTDQSIIAVENMYDIYMEFFNMKIHRNLTQKRGDNENAENFERALKDKIEKNMECHKLIAAFTLLPDEYLNLLTEEEKTKVLNYTCDSEEAVDLCKVGIITSITESRAKFLHFTFAEFLLAKFATDKLCILSKTTIVRKSYQKYQEIQAILDYFLHADNMLLTRKFLNCSILKKLPILTDKYNPLLNIKKQKDDIFLIAVKENNCNIAEFIIKCLQDNKEQINELLQRQYINYKFDKLCNGTETVLHIAARYSSKEMVLMLLEKGADCNILTNRQNTPLHLAANYGRCDVVTVLLDHEVDVNHSNEYGDTALMSAAQKGRCDVVTLLLDREVDVNHSNEYGDTALMSAAQKGRCDVVTLLLDREVDVNHSNEYGDTALMSAAQKGRCDVVTLLLDRGADVNHSNKRNVTALMLAARIGNCDLVTLLLDRGADLDDKDNKGRTSLMCSACNRHNDVMTLLLATGKYNIYDTDYVGQTALHWAAELGHCLNIKTLLDHEAEMISQGTEVRTPLVNCQDKKGKTALYVAVEWTDSLQCVQYLIQRGADRSITDNKGKTALDECGDYDIGQWMLDNQNNSNIEVQGELSNNRDISGILCRY